MFTLLNKIIDTTGKIVGYTLASEIGEELSVPLKYIHNYINTIAGGQLKNGYLSIKGIRSSLIPTIKTTNNVKNVITGYLKWGNVVIGCVYNHTKVKFTNNTLNDIVSLLTQQKDRWTQAEYTEFLLDRIVSKNRRDMEKILFRLGLTHYNPIKIAELTYALNPKDLFWLSPTHEMTLEEALQGTFTNIFRHSINEKGNSVDSPDGQNIKSYAISHDRYGISKKRLHNLSTDAESEVAVYNLSKLFVVDVCPAWFIDKDTIFSQFVYKFSKEYIIHAKRFFKDGEQTGDLYKDLITKFPKIKKDVDKMCILDFITRQDDRHLSNIAILRRENTYGLYPLYDNGRSLFYEDSEQTAKQAANNIIEYSTSFGNIGTYYDVVVEISKTTKISSLINLNITAEEVAAILKKSRFTGYRLTNSIKWIIGAVDILKKLG